MHQVQLNIPVNNTGTLQSLNMTNKDMEAQLGVKLQQTQVQPQILQPQLQGNAENIDWKDIIKNTEMVDIYLKMKDLISSFKDCKENNIHFECHQSLQEIKDLFDDYQNKSSNLKNKLTILRKI